MSRVLFAIVIALLSLSAVADFDESAVRVKVERRTPVRRVVATKSVPSSPAPEVRAATASPSLTLRI